MSYVSIPIHWYERLNRSVWFLQANDCCDFGFKIRYALAETSIAQPQSEIRIKVPCIARLLSRSRFVLSHSQLEIHKKLTKIVWLLIDKDYVRAKQIPNAWETLKCVAATVAWSLFASWWQVAVAIKVALTNSGQSTFVGFQRFETREYTKVAFKCLIFCAIYAAIPSCPPENASPLSLVRYFFSL